MYNLKATKIKPLMSTIPDALSEKMTAIETGRWTVDDVLETMVDDVGETTTAVSVGSGIPAKLGMSKPNHSYEKLKASYEEYLNKSGKKNTKKTVSEFIEKTSPGNDAIMDGFIKYMRKDPL